MQLLRLSVMAVLACAAGATFAQGWTPQKNVELVVPNPPGGSNDKTARTIERILLASKALPVSLTVVNKPGGGGNIAYNYTHQHANDPHVLVVSGPPILTNHITGSGKLHHSEFTPIASLFDDYTVYAVNPGGPIATGKDLVARLRKDPKSVATGFSPLLGSHNHIAAGLLIKAIGGSPRDLKAVAFKGSAEAIPALMGGHIELVTTAAGNVAGHVASGKLRVVATSAKQRLPGALANIPTWQEQGVNVVFGAWRAVLAPKGLTPAQIAYWEGVLRKATEAPEWKEDLDKNVWSNVFLGSAQFAKELDKDYADMKSVLVDIGLAK
ncbi:MAG TPA: tripartite tricarboxylate transporter substrate binding protein [Burkholderiales bacterium]|nr:tripartite tricarboxylate transporter substrate binding protein [Burkholderiales bacterium]